MSTLKVTNIAGLTGSSTDVMEGLAKVWCNLNGTGTISIRDSFNTSSIRDDGSGNYAVIINNNMNSNAYSVSGSVVGSSGGSYYSFVASNGANSQMATTEYEFTTIHASGAIGDQDRVSTSVHGDLA